MQYNRAIVLLIMVAVFATGCGLFGSDGETASVEVAEPISQEPTANIVEPAVQPTAIQAEQAAIPTAVTIPATPVPPEPTPDRSQPTTYVVQSGDVLGLIAQRFDVEIAELRRVNDLSGNLIRVGQTLTIPALESAAAEGDETASGVVGSTETPEAAEPVATPTPVSCGANAVGHCVQSGDSLLGIAATYGVSVDDLRAANPGVDGDTIRIGDLLTIPGQSPSSDGGSTDDGANDTDPSGDPTPTPLPQSNEDCAARNPEYPYFHAADGLCYANPIGGTAVPTAPGSTPGTTCPDGTFLWDDGLCYPIPGATATPVPATPTPHGTSPDYGTTPCEEPYFVASSTGKCFLTEEGKEAGKGGAGTPVPTATP